MIESLVLSTFLMAANMKEEYSCAEIRAYVAMFGIEFVVREAKKRGAGDEKIRQMRAKCKV